MLNTPERACGITILPHKNSGSEASLLKRTCLQLRWASGELEKRMSGGERGGRKGSERVLVVKPIEVEQGRWRGWWYVDWRRSKRRGGEEGGGLLFIIWRISTTPAPHSPTPKGSHPRCVNHRPPMDLLKSGRNQRLDWAPPSLPSPPPPPADSHLPEACPFHLNSACLSKEQIIFLIMFVLLS